GHALEMEEDRGTGTWGDFVDLGMPMWRLTDRAATTIYELTGPPLAFWHLRYGDFLQGQTAFLPTTEPDPLLQPGRSLVLDDSASSPQAVEVISVAVRDTDGDRLDDHAVFAFS